MNATIELLHTHHSDRSFKADAVPDELLAAIVEAAYRAPTSYNSQEISLVVVRESSRRAAIAKIAGGQPWITQAPVFIEVIADLHKTALGVEKAGKQQAIQRSVEGVIAASVDAGIALEALMTAARALGLGVVPIGGTRRDPQAMIDLLGLPANTFPIAGVAIGYVEHPAELKPRLPIESFRHDERYNEAVLRPAIDAYDLRLAEHWRQTGRAEGLPWSENMAGAYSTVYFPKVKPVAAHQGFTNEE